MSEESKQFDFDTMAVVLAALQESGVTLGTKHYQLMSTFDSQNRSQSSFEHQFRKVKARAKEIRAKVQSGDIPASTPATKSRTKKDTPAKSSGKRGRKAASEKAGADKDDKDDNESPTKKVKSEPAADADEDEDGEMV